MATIGVYKITSPSGKVYIGQSVNIEQRWNDYNKPSYFKRCNQPKLKNSALKYGIKNHKFEILTSCSIEELNTYERYYQEVYNSVKEGLNCVYVDEVNGTYLHTEETKRKISEGNKGYKKWLGKKLTDEHKKKISDAKKGKPLIHSEQGKKNIRLASIRGVYQIDPETKEILGSFESIKDASELTGCSRTNIGKFCKGNIKPTIKKVGGYLWCYKEDYDIKYKSK